MALITLKNVSWGVDHPPILENIDFQVEKGERVCLTGRNGVGKSTLLKLLGGSIRPDSGEIIKEPGMIITDVEQEVPLSCHGTVFDVVARSLGETGIRLAEYKKLSEAPGKPPNVSASDPDADIQGIQHWLDENGGWTLLTQIERSLSQNRLAPDSSFDALSSGLKRRVLFAAATAQNPDLVLLDEPTNHLDIHTILWIEEFIVRHVKTLVFVTHDREFLRKIATRIVEIDRGKLISYDCDYTTYLKRRQEFLDTEEKHHRQFDKRLSQEEAWIRQGVKARRTRNEGRVRELIKMREAYRQRRAKMGNVRMQINEAERTGKLVIETQKISYKWEDHPVFTDFSTLIMRGDKIGIIGHNGIGKTTLLKVLLKELEPNSGSIRHGENIRVAYYDQLRMQIDPQKTVQENVGEGNDFVVINGQKRHVISYLKDFMFTPERSRTPVYVLSGGEKNRLMLARLFLMPANLLVLDEPTNDLDMETLELLEEMLFEFHGTLLLVSHDRAFLNNLVTSTIVFEKPGHIAEYPGGYDDWLIQRPKIEEKENRDSKTASVSKIRKPVRQKAKKLSYRQQCELDALPLKIDDMETEQKDLYARLSDPVSYKEDKDRIAYYKARLEALEEEISEAYSRWEELEQLRIQF